MWGIYSTVLVLVQSCSLKRFCITQEVYHAITFSFDMKQIFINNEISLFVSEKVVAWYRKLSDSFVTCTSSRTTRFVPLLFPWNLFRDDSRTNQLLAQLGLNKLLFLVLGVCNMIILPVLCLVLASCDNVRRRVTLSQLSLSFVTSTTYCLGWEINCLHTLISYHIKIAVDDWKLPSDVR